jgi:hypothetical protein
VIGNHGRPLDRGHYFCCVAPLSAEVVFPSPLTNENTAYFKTVDLRREVALNTNKQQWSTFALRRLF